MNRKEWLKTIAGLVVGFSILLHMPFITGAIEHYLSLQVKYWDARNR